MWIADHRWTIDACRFCFMCRHVCTLGVTSGKESDTPRGKALVLSKILRGHLEYDEDLVEALYRCCLCGLCQTWCQAECTPPAAVLAARADIVALGREPAAVRAIRENVVNTGNPFGLPAHERFRAIQAPDLFRDRADVLYYVGCDAAYQRPEIARAMIHVLREAQVDFTLLGDECSTGKPLLALGYRDEAKRIAERLCRAIRGTQCRTLVATCPSSLDALKNDYPTMGLELAGIEILHASQCLDRLIRDGRLPLNRSVPCVATLLDSTYLGRFHQIYEDPRRVLRAIPRLQLREMTWTRELAYACGESAGVFRLLYRQASAALAQRVLAEASRTGAEVLATACPAAKTALLEAGQPGPAVRDVVELVAEAI